MWTDMCKKRVVNTPQLNLTERKVKTQLDGKLLDKRSSAALSRQLFKF